jgi:hypothetical protein
MVLGASDFLANQWFSFRVRVRVRAHTHKLLYVSKVVIVNKQLLCTVYFNTFIAGLLNSGISLNSGAQSTGAQFCPS